MEVPPIPRVITLQLEETPILRIITLRAGGNSHSTNHQCESKTRTVPNHLLQSVQFPRVPHLNSITCSFPGIHPPTRFQDPKTRKTTLPEKLAVYNTKLGPKSSRNTVQRSKGTARQKKTSTSPNGACSPGTKVEELLILQTLLSSEGDVRNFSPQALTPQPLYDRKPKPRTNRSTDRRREPLGRENTMTIGPAFVSTNLNLPHRRCPGITLQLEETPILRVITDGGNSNSTNHYSSRSKELRFYESLTYPELPTSELLLTDSGTP